MLQNIKKSVLKKLQTVSGETLLTAYVPLEKGMKGHKFNQSQLHNLKSELKKVVSTQQHKKISSEIELILEKIGYQNESVGIAMFYDGSNINSYTLPFVPEKAIDIDTKYNLKQIKDYYKNNKYYYVLAISKKGSKLYQGDMEKLKIVQVDGLGKDMQSTLNIDEGQLSVVQNHQVSAGGSDGIGFHGHGGYKDLKKIIFEDYLRYIDKKILATIKDKSIPLVLVAVDYGQSAYKHVSKYPSILMNGVSTNPDDLSPIELHKKTFPLLGAA
jgi:hypothetical protein